MEAASASGACGTRYSSDQIKQQVLDDLQCPICLETLSRPRILPCGHSYCGPEKNCLQILQNSGGFKCALCNVKSQHTSVHEIPPHFAMKKVLESLGTVSVSLPKFKICEEHESEKKLFCESCNVTICDERLGITHRGHVVELYEKMVGRKLTDMLDDYKQSFERFQNLSTSTKNLRQTLSKFDNTLKKVENDVKQCMDAQLKVPEAPSNSENPVELYENLENWLAIKNKSDPEKLLDDLKKHISELQKKMDSAKPKNVEPSYSTKVKTQAFSKLTKKGKDCMKKDQPRNEPKRRHSLQFRLLTEELKKQILSEEIYPIMINFYGANYAGGPTNKLLELNISEIIDLLEDYDAGGRRMRAKVEDMLGTEDDHYVFD